MVFCKRKNRIFKKQKNYDTKVNKTMEELLGIFMSGAVLITGGVLPQKNAATAEGATDYGINNSRIENEVSIISYLSQEDGQNA